MCLKTGQLTPLYNFTRYGTYIHDLVFNASEVHSKASDKTTLSKFEKEKDFFRRVTFLL